MNFQRPPTLVLRPGNPQPNPGALWSAAGWCAMSVAFLLRFRGTGLLVTAILDLAAIVGSLAIFWRSRRRSSLSLAGDGLAWTGAFRDRKVSPVRVVEADVRWSRTSVRRTRVWLLVSADGRAEVSLNVDDWGHQQLEEVRQRLGIPREALSKTLSGKELRERSPGSVPWAVMHPIALTYLLIAAIVASVLIAQHS